MPILSHQCMGSGDPLVFLHGLGADLRQSTSALAPLAEEGVCSLIAVDLPAHGDSAPTAELSFNRFATEVLALIDHLGISDFHLGGLSMGAGISLNLALRVPERVKSLTLLRPSWKDAPCPSHLEIVARIGRWIEAYGIEKAETLLNEDADYLELKSRAPEVAASLPPLFTRPQAVAGAAVLSQMYEDAPLTDLNGLRALHHPTLILDTTYDDLHPPYIAETLSDALPNVITRKNLPPRYKEKEAYNEALRMEMRTFLGEV